MVLFEEDWKWAGDGLCPDEGKRGAHEKKSLPPVPTRGFHDLLICSFHQQHSTPSGLATKSNAILDYSPPNRCLISVHNGKKESRSKYVFPTPIICEYNSRITFILPVKRPVSYYIILHFSLSFFSFLSSPFTLKGGLSLLCAHKLQIACAILHIALPSLLYLPDTPLSDPNF